MRKKNKTPQDISTRISDHRIIEQYDDNAHTQQKKNEEQQHEKNKTKSPRGTSPGLEFLATFSLVRKPQPQTLTTRFSHP